MAKKAAHLQSPSVQRKRKAGLKRYYESLRASRQHPNLKNQHVSPLVVSPRVEHLTPVNGMPPIFQGGMKLFQLLALVQHMDVGTELYVGDKRVIDMDWHPLSKRIVLRSE